MERLNRSTAPQAKKYTERVIQFGEGNFLRAFIDWIICVIFAYLTNRTWVFKAKAQDTNGVIRECAAFMIGRLGTLALEEAALWLGIDMLHMNSMPVKILAQVLVIIGNYVISKFFVFRA